MTPFKNLAIGVLLVSSASLALAQGPGISSSGANLPPHTNLQGTAQTPAGSAQTTHAKKKTSKRSKMSKKSTPQ